MNQSAGQVPSRTGTLQCAVVGLIAVVDLQITVDGNPTTSFNIFVCGNQQLIRDSSGVLKPFHLSSRADLSESAGGGNGVPCCFNTLPVFFGLHLCVFMEDPVVGAEFAHKGTLEEPRRPFVKVQRQVSLVIATVEIPLCIIGV